MQLELQVVGQLRLSLFAESLLVNFTKSLLEVVEYRKTSNCLFNLFIDFLKFLRLSLVELHQDPFDGHPSDLLQE